MKSQKKWWAKISTHTIYSTLLSSFIIFLIRTFYYLKWGDIKNLPWDTAFALILARKSIFLWNNYQSWFYTLFSGFLILFLVIVFFRLGQRSVLKSKPSTTYSSVLKNYRGSQWKVVCYMGGVYNSIESIDGPYCPDHKIRLVGEILLHSNHCLPSFYVSGILEKPYKCTECSYTIPYEEALKNYLAIQNYLSSNPTQFLQDCEPF